MDEAKIMCASKIGILSHSLLNVYENAMVSSQYILGVVIRPIFSKRFHKSSLMILRKRSRNIIFLYHIT